ncbi:UNVERIFIED_CONTAM: hypothetical protein PYX00_005759 [Menopon gallinae]|uniref:Uncharacterized protein n=1 Tax=Menopon gallinae TaxID=328185 RepID=A0AAW2HT75_9NEOP
MGVKCYFRRLRKNERFGGRRTFNFRRRSIWDVMQCLKDPRNFRPRGTTTSEAEEPFKARGKVSPHSRSCDTGRKSTSQALTFPTEKFPGAFTRR